MAANRTILLVRSLSYHDMVYALHGSRRKDYLRVQPFLPK